MIKLKSKIPSVYHKFFPAFIENNLPEEKLATCASCTICQSASSPYRDTKCCTYYPYLANYLVGGILQDNSPTMTEGKKRVRALIQRKEGVTPYGILPPKWYRAIDKKFVSGQDGPVDIEKVRLSKCPYLDGGNCTIWNYRENKCSTHFCISVGGSRGKAWARIAWPFCGGKSPPWPGRGPERP